MNMAFKKYGFLSKTVLFITVPLAIYFLQDFPRRTVLKETFSLLTILAFVLMLGQFFLTRGFRSIEQKGKMSQIVKVHKFIGYFAAIIIILHPILIVLPRYFEGGVQPMQALIKIISTINTVGVFLGLTSWLLLVILVISSIFRDRLFAKYRGWRLFHGILSLLFISLASLHVIYLGRHANLPMKIWIIMPSSTGITVLITRYRNDYFQKKGREKWQIKIKEKPLVEESLLP